MRLGDCAYIIRTGVGHKHLIKKGITTRFLSFEISVRSWIPVESVIDDNEREYQ